MNAFKLFVRSLAGTLFFLLILFFCAGRITYWQGWLYATVNILCLLINALGLSSNEELAEERSSVRTGAKGWDKKILGISALVLIITYVTSGFDTGRFLWSPGVHWCVNALGVLFILTGEVFFFSAQKENRFFSSVVRIQTERGHSVCDTGVYRIVRHPSYLGMIITALGIPLTLGSFWSFIPAAVSILLTILRTSLEDKTLSEELNGYREYAVKTRYRLLPGVW
jgi:protein-S-isoprenylcysteine O-methyltransferase Ste14